MDPLTMLGIGAGVGTLKSLIFDAPRASRQNKLAVETIRYSPWTGMLPQAVEEPNYFGSAIQGAALGGLAGQGLGLFKPSPVIGAGTVADSGNEITAEQLAMFKDKYRPWIAMLGK